MALHPDPALDADIAALRRHHALMVVSEEALELAHREGRAPIDFGALDRALAEAKEWDAKLRSAEAPAGDAELLSAMQTLSEGDARLGHGMAAMDWRYPWTAFGAA